MDPASWQSLTAPIETARDEIAEALSRDDLEGGQRREIQWAIDRINLCLQAASRRRTPEKRSHDLDSADWYITQGRRAVEGLSYNEWREQQAKEKASGQGQGS